MWCCTGIREQGCLARLHCSELPSLSGAPLSIKARWSATPSWMGHVVSVPAWWKSASFFYWSHIPWARWCPLRVSIIAGQAGQLLHTTPAVSLSFRFSENPVININRQKASPSVIHSYKRNAEFLPLIHTDTISRWTEGALGTCFKAEVMYEQPWLTGESSMLFCTA